MASEETPLKDLGVPKNLGPYVTSEELYSEARKFSLHHGFVVTNAGNADSNRIRLKCDRGGVYRSRRSDNEAGGSLRPNTSSRLINCPFRINGKKRNDGWFMNITSRYHNHDAEGDLSGHSQARVMTEEERATITTLAISSVTRKKIMSVIRQKNPDTLLISRDISNAVAKERRQKLGGRTPFDALLDILKAKDCIYR